MDHKERIRQMAVEPMENKPSHLPNLQTCVNLLSMMGRSHQMLLRPEQMVEIAELAQRELKGLATPIVKKED